MKRGIGSQRQYWRIREYMDARRMLLADVCRELRVSATTVYETARGRKNNRKVLRHLLEMGVPPKYLDLPEDLRADAKKKEVA